MKLEDKLVEASKSNDSKKLNQVYEEIYNSYHGLIAFNVYKILNNDYYVEDIVNESFLTLFNYENKVNIRSIKYFLVTISKNLALKYQNNKEFYLEKEINSTDNFSNLMEEIRKILGDDYELFYDYIVNGFKSKELAVKYNISSQGIRMRISRMKKLLKKKLKGVN